jgi:hypothetical protein
MNLIQHEEKVFWKNGSLITEGMWFASGGDAGVVICHPHPQIGGSMQNNVVEAIREAFAELSFATLRFNFRGVGGSTGEFDEGKGEVQDVLSACEYMQSRGVKKIVLAGYSFGAWVCCRLLKDHPYSFSASILVSPPDKFVPFDWTGLEGKVDLIICGSLDPYCDSHRINKQALRIGAKLVVLKDIDHFYSDGESQLAGCLAQFIKERHDLY